MHEHGSAFFFLLHHSARWPNHWSLQPRHQRPKKKPKNSPFSSLYFSTTTHQPRPLSATSQEPKKALRRIKPVIKTATRSRTLQNQNPNQMIKRTRKSLLSQLILMMVIRRVLLLLMFQNILLERAGLSLGVLLLPLLARLEIFWVTQLSLMGYQTMIQFQHS